jgi:hypothetical protein
VFKRLADKIAGWYAAKIRARARGAVKKELQYKMEMNYPDFYTEFDGQKV